MGRFDVPSTFATAVSGVGAATPSLALLVCYARAFKNVKFIEVRISISFRLRGPDAEKLKLENEGLDMWSECTNFMSESLIATRDFQQVEEWGRPICYHTQEFEAVACL